MGPFAISLWSFWTALRTSSSAIFEETLLTTVTRPASNESSGAVIELLSRTLTGEFPSLLNGLGRGRRALWGPTTGPPMWRDRYRRNPRIQPSGAGLPCGL